VIHAFTSGHLFGTTYYDGAYNLGAVYQLFPRQPGEWNKRVLYSFQGGSDGQNSISNLVFDAAGNLYGTTSEGGLGSGVIFELTPIANARWSESVPHRFQGPPDAGFAYNGMVADGSGNFYGATVHGGVDGEGTIYQFTPNQKSRDSLLGIQATKRYSALPALRFRHPAKSLTGCSVC